MKADLDESCASTPPSAIALMVIIEFSASRALTPSLSPKIQSVRPPLHHQQHLSLSFPLYTPHHCTNNHQVPFRYAEKLILTPGFFFSFSSPFVSAPPFKNYFLKPSHLLLGFFFLFRPEYTHPPFKKRRKEIKEKLDLQKNTQTVNLFPLPANVSRLKKKSWPLLHPDFAQALHVKMVRLQRGSGSRLVTMGPRRHHGLRRRLSHSRRSLKASGVNLPYQLYLTAGARTCLKGGRGGCGGDTCIVGKDAA